jgi:PAS domain S-box-containing protein
MRALARTSIAAYGVAIVAVVTAVLIRWLLDPLMGDTLPLVTLFGAVAAAVWAGGYRLAMATAVVGYIACAYLFIEPRGQLGLQDTTNIVGLAAYLFTCSLIVAFGQALRVAQVRANDRGELLRVTLSSIGDAVITTDVDGRVTYLNAVAESLTGWTQREARGQPLTQVFRIVNEETRAPVESPATKALRDGVVVGLANHTMLIRKDGTERPIDDSAAPIRGEHGEVSGCVMIFRDVSTQRQTERDRVAQLHTARMLASIVENSDDAIISKSLDGVIRSWNAAAQRVFGYSAEEAVGRHVSLVIPRERIAEEDHIIASLRAGQRIDHFETERQRKDGQRILVSLTVSPIKDDTGSVVGASKIVRDITERRRTEADRERFVTLIETSTDFVGICDMNAVPLFVNRAGLAMVGLDSIDEARAKTVRTFSSRKTATVSCTSSFRKSSRTVTERSRFASGISRRGRAAGCRTRCSCCATPRESHRHWRRSARTLPSESGWRTICGSWRRTCPRPIGARMNSSRRSHTNCAIRWRRCATCWKC